jgi:hypothetical protein
MFGIAEHDILCNVVISSKECLKGVMWCEWSAPTAKIIYIGCYQGSYIRSVLCYRDSKDASVLILSLCQNSVQFIYV